jgi:hypothetical protein
VEKRADDESRHVALLRQLSERLTAAGNYVKAAQRPPGSVADHTSSPPADILERALALLEQAGEIVVRLQRARDGSSHANSDAGRSYRVCFMNRFARGSNMITTCQRSIVIPSAESRESAIEAAKQRFAELEGIRDWQIHASFIEAGLLEDDAAAGCETHEKTRRP